MNEDPRAVALRGLASLLRSGVSPMAALQRWPRDVPSEVRPEVQTVAVRIATGFPLMEALASIERSWGDEGRTLATSFGTCLRTGGDLAATVDDLATSVQASGGRARNARAAAAGARLSGRVILGLPVMLLLLSGAIRGGVDSASMGAVSLGAVLGGLGSFWIARLTPRPPPDDGLALAVDGMSRSLSAGASLIETLAAAAIEGSSESQPRFERARDLMVLGLEPRRAFERAGLPELADRFGDAIELGVPLSDSLRSLARVRRAEAASDFEARLRRAPVMMAIPLSLCLLPSFFLIGFAPLLDSL